jgi:hypothetical protein
MGSLVYVEVMDNPRYIKFLSRAFPWIGHIRKNIFMTPFVAAAKDDRSGIVNFFVTEEAAWTATFRAGARGGERLDSSILAQR